MTEICKARSLSGEDRSESGEDLEAVAEAEPRRVAVDKNVRERKG